MGSESRLASGVYRAGTEMGLHPVFAQQNGQVSGQAEAFCAAGNSQARHDGGIISGGGGQHVLCGLDGISLAPRDLHNGLPVKSVHVHGHADGCAPGTRRAHGDVDRPGIRIAGDGDRAVFRGDSAVRVPRA